MLSRSVTFDGSFESIKLETTVIIEGSEYESAGRLVVVPEEGANRTRQLPAGTTTVTLDLSAFDDQTVQLRYESPRGGSLQVARLRVILSTVSC